MIKSFECNLKYQNLSTDRLIIGDLLLINPWIKPIIRQSFGENIYKLHAYQLIYE